MSVWRCTVTCRQVRNFEARQHVIVPITQGPKQEGMLMIGRSLALAALGLAFSFLAAPASSAPTANLNGVQTARSAAEPVHYYGRRCWRHPGHYHCRRYVRPYAYGPYYRPYYAPGFGFYFGGGHRHW